MMYSGFCVSVLFATSLLMSGCKKTEKAPAAEPAGATGSAGSAGSAGAAGSAAAGPAAPAASAPPAAAAPAAGGTGLVPAATLAAIELPVPKGAPAKGIWSQATPLLDGDRFENFVDGSDYWVSLRFIDCNLPAVKATASKPDTERGDFLYCFGQPTGKLKDYPLFSPHDTRRVVKVGHVVVIADLGATGETQLKTADLEAFLASLDLAPLAAK